MKPRLTERSERKSAWLNVTPHPGNLAMNEPRRDEGLTNLTQAKKRVLLGVGFNSRSDLRALALRKSRAH